MVGGGEPGEVLLGVVDHFVAEVGSNDVEAA